MMNCCNACKVEFQAGDITVACEGRCEGHRYFHAKCVGLSYDEGCACLHRNIFWMCDSCSDLIERGRFKTTVSEKENTDYATKNEVNLLKSEVERINNLLSRMETNATSVLNQFDSSSREVSQFSLDKHSSPLTSTGLHDSDRPVSVSDKIDLYVSNIAPDVTNEELEQMVCESIGATNVLQVKCLVSSWRNVSTLDYVSFKVSIDARFRDSALRRSSWPNGVRCREFVDHSNVAWRPLNRTA